MSYYDEKLTYIMADLLIHGFKMNPLKESIEGVMDSPCSNEDVLEIINRYVAPCSESPLIRTYYEEGKIKSHELNEVVGLIQKKLSGRLEARSSNLFSSLIKFYRFKNSLSISFSEEFNSNPEDAKRGPTFMVKITLSNLSRYTTKIIMAILQEFNFDLVGYCDEVSAQISLTQENQKITLFDDKLERITLAEERNFLTLDDKELVMEFFSQSQVQQILFKYLFPETFDEATITEITFDKLRERTIAQKRRRIRHLTGKYEALHDVLTPFTTGEEFVDIITRNDICGVYASVRTSRSHHLCTVLMDLDMSRFLKHLVSPQTAWTFTLALARQIIENCLKLGLPYPLVVFSGSRGVHLIYRAPQDFIQDDYHLTNVWQTFLLPAQKKLFGNKKSPLRSKFILVKKVFEAILLYTAYKFDVEQIPQSIRTGLGLTSIHNLFTLSPFSENMVGVLLDTSTLNASVHRIFSFHLGSGRITIPLTDPITRELDPKFEDHATVLQEADPEVVIKNLKEQNDKQYFQFPPLISEYQLKNLLHPVKGILPIMAIITRFSDKYVTERSYYSFKFWYGFFKMTTCYDYLLMLLISADLDDEPVSQLLLAEAKDLISESNLITKRQLLTLITRYFSGKESFSSVKIKIDAYKNFEFLYKLKSDALQPIGTETLATILEGGFEFRSLLREFAKIYSMALSWLSYFIERSDRLNKDTLKIIKNLHHKLMTLLELIKKNSKKNGQHDENISFNRDVVFMILLHDTYLSFLKSTFKITSQNPSWRSSR